VLQKKFSNMMKLMSQMHLEQVSTEHTGIGTRTQRLELIKARLEVEYDSYTKLETEANAAEMAEVITQYNTAQTVYSASLQASAKISQLSLANFL
jgi:flagellar hook-associated protein 3 FlgL